MTIQKTMPTTNTRRETCQPNPKAQEEKLIRENKTETKNFSLVYADAKLDVNVK